MSRPQCFRSNKDFKNFKYAIKGFHVEYQAIFIERAKAIKKLVPRASKFQPGDADEHNCLFNDILDFAKACGVKMTPEQDIRLASSLLNIKHSGDDM